MRNWSVRVLGTILGLSLMIDFAKSSQTGSNTFSTLPSRFVKKMSTDFKLVIGLGWQGLLDIPDKPKKVVKVSGKCLAEYSI